MISGLFPRIPRQNTIDALYGAIVAQARSPVFYRGYGVPDTVTGRLEMITYPCFPVFPARPQRHGNYAAAWPGRFRPVL